MAALKAIPTGTVFGRLVVIGAAPRRSGDTRAYWTCRCDCGTVIEVSGKNLRTEITQSCRCLQRDRLSVAIRKHGHSLRGQKTRTYATWRGMLERCRNPKNKKFPQYGGRGISACKAWRDSFASFLNDMGERPIGRTLDRIDNRFGYFMSNCRWATPKEQAANRGGQFAA